MLSCEEFTHLIWTECWRCNVGDESEDRFAFRCESDEMLSHPSYHFLTLSSLSIIAYFPSFLTHLSHIPWEEQNRTCTVECGTRERDVAQWVWISGRISHNPGIIFPSMRPQSHRSYPARSSPPVISPTLYIPITHHWDLYQHVAVSQDGLSKPFSSKTFF